MARAIWSGSLFFGLVNVPVGLFSASKDHDLHFHQFEKGMSARVRNKRVNEDTGKEVDYDDVVKGAEVGDGERRDARTRAISSRTRMGGYPKGSGAYAGPPWDM